MNISLLQGHNWRKNCSHPTLMIRRTLFLWMAMATAVIAGPTNAILLSLRFLSRRRFYDDRFDVRQSSANAGRVRTAAEIIMSEYPDGRCQKPDARRRFMAK